MGDDSFAQGIFPPPPGVMYGALRAASLANGLEAGSYLDELIQASENLSFHFMALQAGADQYFPMPIDLIVPKSRNINLLAQTLELHDRPKYSNAPTPKILKSTYNGKAEDDPKLMALLSLERYLNGIKTNLNVRKRSDFMCLEPKIGIGRNRDSHVADNGKLFRIQANRLATNSKNGTQHLRFLLGFEGLEMPKEGWLALGGERRMAFFEDSEPVNIPLPDINASIFKIYLATSAVFENGWRPDKLLMKYGLNLLTAALDRPLHVGGWEMRSRNTMNADKLYRSAQPKPMVQCVPAGSVYYVQAENPSAAQEAAKAIHGKSISDNFNQTNYCKQGFGIAYVGKIFE
jgi:CRISPR-associated protein Cmr3